jgi:putative flippase GtrA
VSLSGNGRDLRRVPESVRYIFAGGFAAFVSWLVRFPLSLYMPFPVAVTVATAIGMVIGFFSYKHLVFPGSERALVDQVRDFIIVNLASMAVVTGVATLFVEAILPQFGLITQVEEGLAHAIGVAAGAVSNYFGHKTISFRRPTPGTPSDGHSI